MPSTDPYPIFGIIYKVGESAASINVTVRNNTKAVEQTVATNSYGEYVVDLGNLAGGWDNGDVVKVTCGSCIIYSSVDTTNYPDGREIIFYGWQILFYTDSISYDITEYTFDFEIDLELEKFLDKLTLKVSRRIDDEAYFTDFTPDVEVLIFLNQDEFFLGRPKNREKKEIYTVTLFSCGEICSRQFANLVYEDQTPEAIFSNLITTYTDLTPATVASGYTLDRFVAHDYVDALIIKLAELLEYQIKTDAEKNIYFQPRGYTTNTNVIYRSITTCNARFSQWERDYKELCNHVIIKGSELEYNTEQTSGDYYSETNVDTYTSLYSGSVIRAGQTFTPNSTYTLDSCKFYIRKVLAPTGNITATVYATSGGVPTGAALATSGAVDITTIGAVAALQEFTFSSPYSLVKDTVYAICIEYSGGDVANYLEVGQDSSAPTHSGVGYNYIAAWAAQAYDYAFYNLTLEVTLSERPVTVKVLINNVEQSRGNYGVVEESKKITFSTGQTQITVQYIYKYPIYLEKKNQASITSYGTFSKSLWSKWIKSQADARTYAADYLSIYSDPLLSNKIRLPLSWIDDVNVGDKIRIDDDIDEYDQYFTIQKIKIAYTKAYIELTVGSYIPQLSIWHARVQDRIKELEKTLTTDTLQLFISEQETITATESFYPVFESYSIGNQDYDQGLWTAAIWPRSIAAQSFSLSSNNSLKKCQFYIKKVGAPNGNLYARLYSISSGWPSSILATSAAVVANSVSTSYSLIEFTFSTAYSLVASTTYAIALWYDHTGAGDPANCIYIGADNSSPSHSGTGYSYNESLISWETNTWDYCFYLGSTNYLNMKSTSYAPRVGQGRGSLYDSRCGLCAAG